MKRAHLFLSLAILTGCAGLIGVPDLTFDENAKETDGGPTTDGPSVRADGSTDGDGSVVVPACDTQKLQNDPSHCGRCGHDCLGGACNAGKCESVLVRGGLENPDDLVVDAANVYVTARGNGAVLRIAKADGKTDVLASGQVEARGVALDGQNLYWSNGSFAGDGGGDYWGGVWGCTLPACAEKRLVTEGDYAFNVRFFGGFLYFAENNNEAIVRVKADGSGRTAVGSGNKPFALAVDSEHVYFTARSGFLERVPAEGGGTQEKMGPLEIGGSHGFVTADADRVYWAYTSETGGTGYVYSALKASPDGPKESYGTANKGSVGVAVDGSTLYWTNEGTFTDDGTNNRDGEILACPSVGCGGAPPTSLQGGLTSPGAITIDGDAVYFLSFGTKYGSADGELRRIAKP